MGEQVLNGDTIDLLQECVVGCRMATESMERIMRYVNNPDLAAIIMKYNEDHIKLGEDIHEILNRSGEQTKEPNPFAAMGAWMESKLKMEMKGDSHEAASLLTDGCNMGIKTLNEQKNKYTDADNTSMAFCDKIIKLEKQFADELQSFL